MKAKFLHILIFLSLSSCALSIWSLKTSYPSGEKPDQIILNPTSNPQNSMSVSWRTSHKFNNGYIEYKQPSGEQIIQDASFEVIDTKNIDLIENDPITHRFSTILKGLNTNTRYNYRACTKDGNKSYCSSWYSFQTAPDQESEFEFLYLGDVQSDSKEWVDQYQKIIEQNKNLRFTLVAGDMLNRGAKRNEMDQFFGGKENIFANVGIFPVLGNHDRFMGGTWLYTRTYQLPDNYPYTEELAYWVKYGSTLIIVLNSNEKDDYERQARWAKEVIDQNPSLWKIVSFHHPVWSAHPTRYNAKLRKAWVPFIESNKIDLVLNGHDHAYMRTYPTIDGKIVKEGPIYIVSVAGEKMYKYSPKSVTAIGFEDIRTYQTIKISPSSLEYQSHDWNGKLMDSFTIKK